LKLKKGAPISGHNPTLYFQNPRRVSQALMEALQEGDSIAFKEILAAFLEVTNKDQFARRSGISRRTLFRMLSPSGNPTLDNIAKVVSTLRKVP
jgi:probable addiction module antidote protein